MEEILEELKALNELAEKKEKMNEWKKQIKEKDNELAKQYTDLELAMIGTYDREKKQQECKENEKYLDEAKDIFNKKEKILIENFKEQKNRTLGKIEENMEIFKTKEEMDALKSQRNAYAKIVDNSKKDVKNMLVDINNGKDINLSKLTVAREEIEANSKKIEKLDKEISSYKVIEEEKDVFSDLGYLKTRIQGITFDNLENIKEDLFVKKYGKEPEQIDRKEENKDNENQKEEEKNIGDTSQKEPENETSENIKKLEKGTNNGVPQDFGDLEKTIEGDEESTTPASKTKKPEIIISRKPTIGLHNHNIQIGTIRKIMRQKPEEIMSKLEGILPDKKPEYLEKMSQKIDPILLEGIVQLKEKNMLTDKEIKETIEKFDDENVIAEEMNFKVTYDMKDLSKGAFLPWNRRDRDMIAQLAEDNKKHGIAEFKDGEEYEPNPIKRMLKRVHTRKLGDGKDEVSQIKHVNTFKKEVKAAAEKSEYDQIRDDMNKAESVKDLEKISYEAKKAKVDGKITASELSGMLRNIELKKGELQKVSVTEKEKEEKEEFTK